MHGTRGDTLVSATTCVLDPQGQSRPLGTHVASPPVCGTGDGSGSAALHPTVSIPPSEQTVRFTNLAECVHLWNALGMKAGPIPDPKVNVSLVDGKCQITPIDPSLKVAWPCFTSGTRVFECPNQGSDFTSVPTRNRVSNASIDSNGLLRLLKG